MKAFLSRLASPVAGGEAGSNGGMTPQTQARVRREPVTCQRKFNARIEILNGYVFGHNCPDPAV
jgi:hypothetical protein